MLGLHSSDGVPRCVRILVVKLPSLTVKTHSAGGIISTISDPTRLIREILALSPLILPTPAEVRAWLHPYSFAGSPATFVGTPWEIFMPEPGELTPAHPHSVAVFSKGGGAYGYRSQMSLVPEYGIGVVTLTAGDGAALTTLHGALLSTVVSAADEAAREEARVLYVGSFTGPCPQTTQSSGNGTAGGGSQAPKCWVNATLELDGDSLVLSALQRNGSDVLAPFGAIWNVTLGAFVGPLETPATFRVFPAEIVSPPEDIVLPGNAARPGTTKVRAVREDWRLWWPITLPPAGPEFPGDRLAEQDCLRWSVADWLYYGQEPVDRVVVVREWLESESRAGRVLALDVPFLRSGLLLPTVTE